MTQRICVVGAGAIGTTIGARLAARGHATSALARGRALTALRAHGWRLRTAQGWVTGPVAAAADAENAADLGPQDVVVIAVKAHALPDLAPLLAPLLASRTVVVPAMNGVPWWFFDGLGGEYDGLRLRAVDPHGTLRQALPTSVVLGCVVHLSAGAPEPGVGVHHAGDGLILGEPAGGGSDRLTRTADLLGDAAFAVTRSPRIQTDIWYKLWGNLTMNPISALTGATTDRILDDDLVRDFASAVMVEAAEIGRRIGCPIDQSPQDRHAVTRKLGAFRTSMLQDADAGRPLELDAMVTVVREIAGVVGVATPAVDALLGLTRLAARTRGLYPPA